MATFIGQSEEIREYQGRFIYMASFVVVAFLLLFIRIWYLQILNGDRFYKYSQEIALKPEKIPATRGILFDRNREVVVDSAPSFDITWTPQYVKEPEQTVSMLSSLLKMPKEEILATLTKQSTLPRFQPRAIKQDVSRDEVALIEAHHFDMPGIDVAVEVKRVYQDGPIGAHLYGYIAEVGENQLDELNRKSFQKYKLGDFVGHAGIEERWEAYLRGLDGATYSEVDAFGRKKSDSKNPIFDYEKSKKDPIPGKNLVLTIHRDLQKAVVSAFKDKVGAVVALDPNTGEVLAMHSQPAFDPTEFSRGVSSELWESLISNPNKPLLDKAIQDAFPPGSTFKLVTALAALEEGLVNPKDTVHCNGHYYLGRGHYRCWTWRKGGHGIVDLHKAIKESCDYYFYRLGVKIGVDTIAKYAKMFGFSYKTGIDLRGEVPGIMPTTEWKLKRFHEIWFPGETPPVAIGQGYVTVTTLQLAKLYAAIANGGISYVPYVVKRIEEPEGELIREFHPQVLRTQKLHEETLKQLREGLYAVVNEPGGTSYFSTRADGFDIAGKTGTSQVVRFTKADEDKKCESLEFKLRDHGWFVGFAPVDHPQIVVAVLAMHDCHPYHGANMVVRDVIKAYLKDRLDPATIRWKKKKPNA
ncbi:MAG: penicillin-binding protein 2 [Deltaproteobacteria bacterium]|nr:penicillin-binding protein 2 [Deltaproteobacteria bacterium]